MSGKWVRGSLGLALIVLALAACCYFGGKYLGSKGMAWAGNFGSLASAVLAALALLVPVIRGTLDWMRGPQPISRIGIPQARDDLTAVLTRQWADEERLRRINDPRPLPVRWEDSPATATLGQSVPLPPGGLAGQFDEIAPLFLRLPSRRLVILGTAGAGKSVLALKLARDLIAAHDAAIPVPVIIPASAWDPDTDLPEWIAEQLSRSHPGLAQRIRDATGRIVTLAEALAADQILPIIDGLDEMAAAGRARAIRKINEFGSDTPLVLTSRPEEYQRAVKDVGRGVSRAAVVEVEPLEISQAKSYLTEATAANPAGRWQPVFKGLDAGPSEPLTQVLSTPLMLWLARTVYEYGDHEPAELLDRARFPDIESLEHHLIGALVPAVYARRTRDGFSCTAHRAERWLAYLASYLDHTGLPVFAWWRLGRDARSWRAAATAVRVALMFTVFWAIADHVLLQNGYWRGDRYYRRGSLHAILLGGTLGRLITPTAEQIFNTIRPRLNLDWNGFNNGGGWHLAYLLPWHSLTAYLLLVAVLSVLAGISLTDSSLTWAPQTLGIRIRSALISIPGAICFMAFLTAFWTSFLLVALHRRGWTPWPFLHTHTTWLTLGVIALFGLSAIPRDFQITLDVSGSLSPAKTLRLTRRSDLITTVSSRLITAAMVWLVAGSQILLAYGTAAALLTILSVLGGLRGPARVYADVRIWLFVSRRMPWRMMPFLADAHRRGVLRQVGTVYQFRHIRLQEYLAAKHRSGAHRSRHGSGG